MEKVTIPAIKTPEIKLSVKYTKRVSFDEQVQISCSYDSFKILRHCFDIDTFLWKEEFLMLCLNRANKILGFYKVSSGGVAGTLADPKVIYTTALNCNASAIVFAHNHPSGNLKPSSADIDLTKKLKEAGRVLDIQVLDHLIVTTEKYYSFADEGIL